MVAPGAAPAAPISVAIVGCGVVGAQHFAVLALHPRFVVTALVDAIDGVAEALAGAPGAAGPRAYTQLTDALAGSDPQLIVVCTPSGLHVAVAQQALAAGRHIVIEKPLDVDLARGRRLVELAQDAAGLGQVCSVISQHRFDPAAVVVARAIASGQLGDLTSGVALTPWWRSEHYYDSVGWRGTWQLDGGGALMNQGIHTLDLLIALMGHPLEISAQTARRVHRGIEVEDVAAATVRFDSGALAVVSATTAGFPGLPTRVQVQGSRGSAVIEGNELTYLHLLAEGSEPSDDSYAVAANQAAVALAAAGDGGDALPADLAGHYRQYTDIARAIDRGETPTMTVDDAFLTLATVVAVYASATVGAPVLLADVLAGTYDALAFSPENLPG